MCRIEERISRKPPLKKKQNSNVSMFVNFNVRDFDLSLSPNLKPMFQPFVTSAPELTRFWTFFYSSGQKERLWCLFNACITMLPIVRSPRGVLFLHDNSPVHRQLQPTRNWPTCASSVLITHPILWIWPCRTTTCSPDRKKKQLKGRHFSSDAEVIAAAETWLNGQPSDFFSWVSCRS